MMELQSSQSLGRLEEAGGYTRPSETPLYSLDEPISQTILRDVQSVWSKMLYVLKPQSAQDAGAGLKDWELWGPLVLSIFLSLLLFFSANGGLGASYSSIEVQKQRRFAFALVYVFVIVGSSVVTLNAQLLGSRLSFFQCICVLGYCLFPLVVAALANLFFLRAPRWFRLLTVLPALVWATRVASSFMKNLIESKRKLLAVYPVTLFYIAISAIICAV